MSFLDYMREAGELALLIAGFFAAVAAVNYPLDRKVREHSE